MENPAFYFLLVLLIIWVGSYFYSMQYNRRKLTWLARWLEDALPLLGSHPSSRWKNQNALSISLSEGRGKIRETLIVLGAQKREILSFIISFMRGGKDSMSFMLALNPPTRIGAEFEIFHNGTPVPRTVMLGLGGVKDWQIEDYPRGAPYKIASRTPEAFESACRVIALLHDDGYDIRRISVRASTPHMMLVFNVQRLPRADAHDLLQLIRNLSDEVAANTGKGGTSGKGSNSRENRPSKQLISDSDNLIPLKGKKLQNGFKKPGQHNPFSKN